MSGDRRRSARLCSRLLVVSQAVGSLFTRPRRRLLVGVRRTARTSRRRAPPRSGRRPCRRLPLILVIVLFEIVDLDVERHLVGPLGGADAAVDAPGPGCRPHAVAHLGDDVDFSPVEEIRRRTRAGQPGFCELTLRSGPPGARMPFPLVAIVAPGGGLLQPSTRVFGSRPRPDFTRPGLIAVVERKRGRWPKPVASRPSPQVISLRLLPPAPGGPRTLDSSVPVLGAAVGVRRRVWCPRPHARPRPPARQRRRSRRPAPTRRRTRASAASSPHVGERDPSSCRRCRSAARPRPRRPRHRRSRSHGGGTSGRTSLTPQPASAHGSPSGPPFGWSAVSRTAT